MTNLYQTNRLSIAEVSNKGVYVDGHEYGPLFLKEAGDHLKQGDQVNAFVYQDASDRIVATMAKARVQVGECAYLKVVSLGDNGAFLDWGLPKDLLLPYSEQAYPVREGGSCVVYVYLDEKTKRAVATTLLHQHLEEEPLNLQVKQPVDLLIAAKSDLGFKAVIDNTYLGLIYHDELSQPLAFGTRIKGWVKNIRDDGKVDLSINTLDQKTRDQLELRILRQLQQEGGRMELSDKSAPEVIFKVFKVSKKNFKRALSSLYKQRLITIEPESIALVSIDNKG